MTAWADAKAELHTRSIEPDSRSVSWTIVAGIVVVAVVVPIAPEAAVVRSIAMMPDARPAMHLVGGVDISDSALDGLRTRKPDGAGGLSEESRRREDGGASQDAKRFLHGYPLSLLTIV
jgi:hypothetical protein